MWKRLLVLVLFLFGVFWWISNRDDVPTVPSDPDVEVSETEETEGDDDSDSDDDEDSDDEEDSETSTTTTSTSTATTTPVVTVAKETVVEEVTTPVVVTPPAPKPAPVPAVTTDATVYLYEWGLDMSQKTFPAGTVNFTVKNSGRRTHELEIRGVGNLGKVTPNMTETFSAQLRPGTYEVFSGRGDDYERGVVDTIVVQ